MLPCVVQASTYTVSQLPSYTVSQLPSYTVSQLPSYTVSQLLSHLKCGRDHTWKGEAETFVWRLSVHKAEGPCFWCGFLWVWQMSKCAWVQGESESVGRTNQHTHPPDSRLADVAKAKVWVKRQAKDTLETLQPIITQTRSTLSQSAVTRCQPQAPSAQQNTLHVFWFWFWFYG